MEGDITRGMADQRIPSLDGVRAVSILLVVAFHIGMIHRVPGIWRVNFGNLGVRTFFVISGFLITTLLLKEHERTGAISLKGFYLRRAFRILPAYWVFLAVVGAMVGMGFVAGSGGALPAVFYYSNYRLPLLDVQQSWSLSVEEQFYFLWPACIVLLGFHRAIRGCALVLLIAPAFRVLFDFGYWHVPKELFAFECSCDALATGCLLAIFRDRLWSLPLYRRVVSSPLAWSVLIAGLAIWAAHPVPVVRDVLAIPFLNVGVSLLLDRYMRLPGTVVGRVLNSRPFAWLGRVSYSLYLWQQPWMFSRLAVPVRLAGAMLCATGSFYLIEQPMLGVRKRLERWSYATRLKYTTG